MSVWLKVIACMQLSKIITVHSQLGYFQTQKLQITPLYIPKVVWRASHIEYSLDYTGIELMAVPQHWYDQLVATSHQ